MYPNHCKHQLPRLIIQTSDGEIHEFNPRITLCDDTYVGFYWSIQVPDNYFDYEEGEE